MSENEAKAIEHIKNLADDYKCWSERISHEESLVLCKLLKEIQAYRAIGTVEDFKNSKIIADERYDYIFDEMEVFKQYASIGTIEEFRSLKASKEFFGFDSPVVNIDMKSYNKAIDEFAERLLEKAPKNYAGGLELGGRSCYLSANQVKEIAEQLKGGAE